MLRNHLQKKTSSLFQIQRQCFSRGAGGATGSLKKSEIPAPAYMNRAEWMGN